MKEIQKGTIVYRNGDNGGNVYFTTDEGVTFAIRDITSFKHTLSSEGFPQLTVTVANTEGYKKLLNLLANCKCCPFRCL